MKTVTHPTTDRSQWCLTALCRSFHKGELKTSYGWAGLSLSGKFASFTLQNMLYFPKLTFEVNLLRVKTWLYIIWVYMQKIVSIGLAVNAWSKHKRTDTQTHRHTDTHTHPFFINIDIYIYVYWQFISIAKENMFCSNMSFFSSSISNMSLCKLIHRNYIRQGQIKSRKSDFTTCPLILKGVHCGSFH